VQIGGIQLRRFDLSQQVAGRAHPPPQKG
jgi:hypothetical protein